MFDQLRELYDGELDYFRSLSTEFAERFPKIAGRLGIDADEIRDPHAERFIQAAALLNARIRHKLEDDFPELVEGLLGVLYPHLLRPMPSVAMVQAQLPRGKGGQTGPARLPRGSLAECETPDGQRLRYRTTRTEELWPLEIEAVRFENQPFEGPSPPGAASRLCLRLRSTSSQAALEELDIDSLRLGITLGQLPAAGRLLELLLESCLEVCWSDRLRTSRRLTSRPTMAGLDPDDAILPHDARSFSGYRLLAEFFAFPEALLFFRIDRPLDPLRDTAAAPFADSPDGGPPELQFFFDREDAELARLVDRTSVRLGLVPVVNLFRKAAPNVPLEHERAEVRVVPDTRAQSAIEVWSVDTVMAMNADGERLPTRPFLRVDSGAPLATDGLYWHAARRPHASLPADQTEEATTGGRGRESSDWEETFLTLVDFTGQTQMAEATELAVQTTCFNRDLPNAISRAGLLPRFALAEQGAVELTTVTRPTPTRRWASRGESRWRWLSHVSLGGLPLSQGVAGPEPLQAMLRLYAPLATGDGRGAIDGLADFACRSDMAFLPGVPGGFCRGVEATLTLDEDRFVGHSPYLLAWVLREVLARYVSVNSFVRLRAATGSMREHDREWVWPPKSGAREIL